MKKILSLLLLGLSYAPYAVSQQTYQPPQFTDPDRLAKIEKALPVVDSIFRKHFEKSRLPGLVYGIVVDGKLMHSGGLGYTDVVKKTPATPKSLFRIASMTKSITAMAILKLRDTGKLRLDDPVETYLPELKKSPGLTSDGPLITIRHLLTHAAGFPEDNPWGDRQLAKSDQEMLTMIGQGISYSNTPGVAFEYSNMGFAMLGRIISVVAKKPYQQYINEEIFKPLGMTTTVWEYSKAPENLMAHGYRRVGNEWQEETPLHDGSYGAMGGLITSIEEFSRYMAVHQQAWPVRNDPEAGPVKRSSVREMQHPWNFSNLIPQRRYPNGKVCAAVVSYAYGLNWVNECQSRITVSHSGGLPGYGSNWQILPEYGIGVVSYANQTYASTGGANWLALDTLVTLASLRPRDLPVSTILEKRKQELVSLLPDWKSANQLPIFAENFFLDEPFEPRRKAMQEVFSKIGKIQKVSPLYPENQLRGVFVVEGETRKINVFFTLTPEKIPLIQDLETRLVK